MQINDVYQAAERIGGRVVRTPVLTLPELDTELGAQIFLKAELHQITGAFKIRGALNKLLTLPPDTLRKGVVAASSGNHGRAVATLARGLAVPAVLVLPADAPAAKIEAVRREGARVVLYDPVRDDRDALTACIAAEEGLQILPSSDDPVVAAGHGTLALELFATTGPLDRLVVPVGGGGLAAGCATVAKTLYPDIEVIGVEPRDGDDTARSLRAGHRVSVPTPDTLADGLRHQSPGRFTFEVNRCLLDTVVTVDDDEIAAGMGELWRHGRLVVEPSGACALAAVLARRPDPAGRRVGVVLSGGNVDEERFHRIIAPHVDRPYASAR
ncbi:threonine/serine dehydratase [Streptomyces sp. STR69]|uniref:threonine ammonia-lyase n=1 Tax=Streptomyces sp. STR69 TaxID=1796942 RepID=UPI0021C7BDB4|nr:threonine/serine dehydratase [Streptomyces sp. STR69]